MVTFRLCECKGQKRDLSRVKDFEIIRMQLFTEGGKMVEGEL